MIWSGTHLNVLRVSDTETSQKTSSTEGLSENVDGRPVSIVGGGHRQRISWSCTGRSCAPAAWLSSAMRDHTSKPALRLTQLARVRQLLGACADNKQRQKHRQHRGQWRKGYRRHAQNRSTTSQMRHAACGVRHDFQSSKKGSANTTPAHTNAHDCAP